MVEKGSNGPTLPNDDDCDRPACGDTVSMLKSVMKRAKQSKGNTPVSKSGQAANNAGTYDNKNTLGCPPGKEELGSSTWTLVGQVLFLYIKTFMGFWDLTRLPLAFLMHISCIQCLPGIQISLHTKIHS
jgi:hypothetical protein